MSNITYSRGDPDWQSICSPQCGGRNPTRNDPYWQYEHEPETRQALDLIFSDYFSRYEPGVFEPLRDMLLKRSDHYMHLADLCSYLEADGRLCALYADPNEWARKAIVAGIAFVFAALYAAFGW